MLVRFRALLLAGALFTLACRPAGSPQVATGPEASRAITTGYEPSRALGQLFHDVQMASLFPDSKTFVDARPRSAPAEIVARYHAARNTQGFNLRSFVEQHFEIPRSVGEGVQSDTSRSMEEHIRTLWPALTRNPDANDPNSSLIPLPNAYIVPGGRFREVYYWDSYFTMLGLIESGRTDLVRNMLDNFAHLIRSVGHIPNGNRTYYLGRSQPPYFAAMVGLYARATDTMQALRYLDALEAEHAFWMNGAARVAPGDAFRRVVRLPDGSVLNRYWDDIPQPRPESYREDYSLAQSVPANQREALYRNLRAGAESGWDFSSRWMRDPSDLRTLEVTDIAPVDLNSLLYHAERTIAALRTKRGAAGDADVAQRFTLAADARRRALLSASYDSGAGFFFDIRWRTAERVTDRPTLAAAAPLYFGLATPEQGRAVAARLERDFLKDGGFVTTLIPSGQQWDAPNGWPPLVWLSIEGARRYGRADLADRARDRWLSLNRRTYKATGKMTEKYDVVDPNRRAGGGEYPTQDGFGWTNGVALKLSAQERAAARPPVRTVPQGAASFNAAPHRVAPALAFPEAGLDNPAAYQGYATRFYRDVAGNTVQVYLDRRANRVVTLLANAENESVGFTVRDARGRTVPIAWGSDSATISVVGATRTIEYDLVAPVATAHVGWILLGSMRVERDLQYPKRQSAAFDDAPFRLPEHERMLGALQRLPPEEQRRHLALVGAADVAALRDRLDPRLTTRTGDSVWVARFVQRSIDARDSLVLEMRVDPRRVSALHAGDSVTLRARSGTRVPFTIRIETSGGALTPVTRAEIFSAEFLAFLARAHEDRSAAGRARARRLERQVIGVELLSSREKLMAGLPTYGTYFGRDMLVSALMMRSIWRDEMSEYVVGSVLRKLSPTGQVSHEEALGGQAVRESADEYARTIDAYLAASRSGRRASADSLLERARSVMERLRQVRENYHMIDDELQLPVLAARWLMSREVSAQRKRSFLLDSSDGGLRIERLLRELSLVARMTAPYAAQPIAANLISFPARDSGWASTSWRDSNAGYAGGRYAMDVNAIWAPHALESMGQILDVIGSLGLSLDSVGRANPDVIGDSPMMAYVREPGALQRAIDRWRGTARHFIVQLSAREIRSAVSGRVAAMPAGDRAYWAKELARTAIPDSLEFLALALDERGTPIRVLNSDPATALFLAGGRTAPHRTAAEVLRDIRHFARAYPVGLLVERVGPVVANDAFASPQVWQSFERDHYHGPRVAWGREVNLFAMGVASALLDTASTAINATDRRELRSALDRVLAAVTASGFGSELWSYEIRNGRLVPMRYGSSADVQLWSTTELAVKFALSRLP